VSGREFPPTCQRTLIIICTALAELSLVRNKSGMTHPLQKTAKGRPPETYEATGAATRLFISGTEDIVFPPPAAVALASLVPGAKLESVPAAGHSVYFERPEIFNRLVLDFFKMHPGPAAGYPS